LPFSNWHAATGATNLSPVPNAAPDNSANHLAWAVLDQLALGVLVLEVGGGVSFANASARAELAHNPWLRIERGQLCARRASDVQDLQDLLWAAARGEHAVLWLGAAKIKTKIKLAGNAAPARSASSAAKVASSPSSFAITATPLMPAPSKTARGKAAAQMVGVPQKAAQQPSHIALVFTRRQLCEPLMLHHFARQHHLTGTEEAVLRHLCDQAELASAARSMGIAVSTVRSHMKSIAQKTGFHGMRALQAHLAALPPLATLAPSPSLANALWRAAQSPTTGEETS
jgi:DNA-binding CsgD family transcriptional regulator